MKTITAEPLFNVKNGLGEGPLWHPTENRLYWVDITAGDLYKSNPNLTSYSKTHFATAIDAFGFKRGGGLVLATAKGFSEWKVGQNAPTILWNPLPDREGVRMNDGKVDPAGRFWAGSMDSAQQQGALYRLDPDGSRHTILNNIGISNGLEWSPDRKTMYYTDSFQYTIFAFDYELKTGTISNRRVFIELPRDNREIVPDGLCVDVEGCIWSAHWNGWEVVRYDPQGNPTLTVQVPAQQVTSCCFGGEHDDLLLITTSRGELSADALAGQPHAGDVFICQTETQGQRTAFFGRSNK